MADPRESMGEQYQLKPEATALSTTGAAAAEANTRDNAQQAGSFVRELVETIVLALLLFLVIRQVVQNYRIESHSMEPNFYEGQFVLVNKLAYRLGEPHRGEVVVFHNPDNVKEDYIKRIIGLPGDSIEVIGDRIVINGQELAQPFAHNLNTEGSYFGPTVVPEDSLFVMGDNRPRSSDSRAIGPIDQDLVVGKAWLRIWPFNLFGLVQHYQLEPGV
ncbi:MAG: signal peptidase I, partial [Caldilineaceae bacterium]